MKPSYTSGFWVCAAIVGAFVLVVFGWTASIPLGAEDLQVYVDYIYFTGDNLVPEVFYGNGFGILPGEFVYKLGRKPEEVGGVYRPLTASLMALDYALCGVKSTCYHITNLLLQVACSIAVLALAWQLTGGNLPISLMAALLFTVNPTHSLTQVVMLQRSDILCTLFYALSVLFFARYVDRPTPARSRTNYALCAIFMVLALMSKEMAVTLPVAFLLYDLMRGVGNPLRLDVVRRLSKRHILFFAMLVGYILLRLAMFHGIGGYPGFAFSQSAAKPAALMLGRHNITSAISGLNHLFGVVSRSRLVRYSLLACIFGPLLFGTGRRIKFAIVMVGLAMLPVIALPSITPLYMYLSSAWFSIAVVASLWWLFMRLLRRRAATIAVIAVVGLGMFFSTSAVYSQIAVSKRRIDFAYRVSDDIIDLVSPMPKGARLYLVTPSMMESRGRVDFDPAIEAILRVKTNDLSLKLWPIPMHVPDEGAILFDAAVLDMEALHIDDRTYFFDNLTGRVRLRNDISERLRIRDAVRSLPGRLPGDYYGWQFGQSPFGWTVTDESGEPMRTELKNDSLVFEATGNATFVVSPRREFSTERLDRFSFTASIDAAGGPREFPVWVEWVSKKNPEWSGWRSQAVTVRSDGDFRRYEVDLGKDFNWVTANEVTRIRIHFPPIRARIALKSASIYFSKVLGHGRG